MKYNVLFLLLLSLIFQACEDCTITELEGPDTFDCPELMVNIGDPCDDGNPDTETDIVNDLCECQGTPINTVCDGVLYASRMTINTEGNAEAWFFDKAEKSDDQLGNFENIELKPDWPLNANEGFGVDFAAFDSSTETYVFTYEYRGIAPNIMYKINDPFASEYLKHNSVYAAPVFVNGNLYAMNIVYDQTVATYNIVQIDLATGKGTLVETKTLTVNSPMLELSLSSTTDQSKMIYFLSGTNLVSYNLEENTSTYTDIDKSHNPDNLIVYSGLEYKVDEQLILALRHKLDSSDKISELISISTDGNFSVNTIFDIKNNLGPDNDQEIEFDFHSTTFSQCDNIYYISEIAELEVDPIESFLIEINLNELTLSEQKKRTSYMAWRFMRNSYSNNIVAIISAT